MISDNIEIITFRSDEGRRIRMTSVHADYLLKDLPLGSPELEGLEPHGTRVRLILRPSIDLETSSLVDIVRKWVILPSCEVLYSEPGFEDQRIGYMDVGEAARALFLTGREQAIEPQSYDVIAVTPETDDAGMYQMACIVDRSPFPERTFVSDEKERRSAVCIEGIRADSHLPGFSEKLCGLLSVKNNKRFRTTVSRENLEVDEEYMKVATLCANACFTHIRNEVDRIRSSEGKPLSRASTAGRVVFHSLRRRSGRRGVSAELDRLYFNLPLVVVEETQQQSQDLLGNRRLFSLAELESVPQFWTIESRAVDYFDVICRDLGREVNVSSFLTWLAPELYESSVNPIVVGPEPFFRDLRRSHSVIEVKFSRRHQRTLLKWELLPALSNDQEIDSGGMSAFDLQRKASEIALRLGYPSGLDEGDLRRILSAMNEIVTAPIEGDKSGVCGVGTRMMTILSEGSEVGKLWQQLQLAWTKADSLPITAGRSTLFVALAMLAKCARENSLVSYLRVDPSEFEGPWRLLRPELKELLNRLGLEESVASSDFSSLFRSDDWFDASRLWRDWAKLKDE